LWGMAADLQKEDWRGVAALLEAEQQSGDRIVLVDEDIHAPLNYAYQGGLPQQGVSRFEVDETRLDGLVQGWADAGGRVWLVQSHHDTDALERAFVRSPRWARELQADFLGVMVQRYRWTEPTGAGG
ncbi:MAG: hypothetical protein GX605_02450, partial [Chloroflexi bacterium]|nr:hypothetical protein [Chloroflexota bacterium]